MYLCLCMDTYSWLWRAEELDSPGAGVTGSCGWPGMGARYWSWVLCKSSISIFHWKNPMLVFCSQFTSHNSWQILPIPSFTQLHTLSLSFENEQASIKASKPVTQTHTLNQKKIEDTKPETIVYKPKISRQKNTPTKKMTQNVYNNTIEIPFSSFCVGHLLNAMWSTLKCRYYIQWDFTEEIFFFWKQMSIQNSFLVGTEYSNKRQHDIGILSNILINNRRPDITKHTYGHMTW